MPVPHPRKRRMCICGCSQMMHGTFPDDPKCHGIKDAIPCTCTKFQADHKVRHNQLQEGARS